jgi:hypothetical protein
MKTPMKTPREDGYTRIAFWAKNYVNRPEFKKRNFETVEPLDLPADGWNSGSDVRIVIPAHHLVKLITSQDAWDLYRLGGVEADRIIGLWIKPAEIIRD